MPVRQLENLQGMLASTLPHLGRKQAIDLTSDIQRFEAMKRILPKKKMMVRGGYAVRANVILGSKPARHVDLYNTDEIEVSDKMTKTETPFRHTTQNYAFDEREDEFNSGDEEQILDLIANRRYGAMVGMYETMEKAFWGKPATSADQLTPWGIFTWLAPNEAEGFNGGNVDGFAAGPGGLDASLPAYSRWRNYTAGYTNITNDDFIKKVDRAFYLTDFEAPVNAPQSDYGMGGMNECVFYTYLDMLLELKELARQQNDNLGYDLITKEATVKRCRIEWVPYFEEDNPNASPAAALKPFVGINWRFMHAINKKGFWMREQGPKVSGTQHNVYVVHVDSSWNVRCVNRRAMMYFCKKGLGAPTTALATT